MTSHLLEFCTFPYTPLPLKGERMKVRGFNERVLSTLTPALSLLKKEGEGRNLQNSTYNIFPFICPNLSDSYFYVSYLL